MSAHGSHLGLILENNQANKANSNPFLSQSTFKVILEDPEFFWEAGPLTSLPQTYKCQLGGDKDALQNLTIQYDHTF